MCLSSFFKKNILKNEENTYQYLYVYIYTSTSHLHPYLHGFVQRIMMSYCDKLLLSYHCSFIRGSTERAVPLDVFMEPPDGLGPEIWLFMFFDKPKTKWLYLACLKKKNNKWFLTPTSLVLDPHPVSSFARHLVGKNGHPGLQNLLITTPSQRFKPIPDPPRHGIFCLPAFQRTVRYGQNSPENRKIVGRWTGDDVFQSLKPAKPKRNGTFLGFLG